MKVIYKIRNVVNGKFYVGSTINQKQRFDDHRRLLRKGKHHCKHLQAAWNKYGEDCFKFEVIERFSDEVSNTELEAAETKWLDEHHGKDHCYNTGRTAEAPWRGVFGIAHPLYEISRQHDTRAKISESLKQFFAEHPELHPRLGKKHTPEAKEKMAKKVVHSGEAHYRFGKTLSEDVRRKIGDTQRGVKKGPRAISEAGRASIRAAADAGHYSHWQGKHHTEEAKAKMSKRVVEITTGTEYASLTKALEATGLKMPTLHRALKTEKPIRSGPCAGLTFRYLTLPPNTDTLAAP